MLIRYSHIGIDEEKLNTFLLGFRFPEKIGGNLPGVHYIRDVADADSLISSLVLCFE